MRDRTPGQRRPPNRPSWRDKNAPGKPVGEMPRLDRESARSEMERFTSLAIREMGLDIKCDVSADASPEPGQDRPEIEVRFHGPDEALLLERNAELLLALEYIAHRWLRLDSRLHDHVRFDCGDYRSTRLDELKLSARVAAQRVRETGQDFHFNPMSSRERRIIHLELNGASGVRTMSEGMGERRHLVIYPENKPGKK